MAVVTNIGEGDHLGLSDIGTTEMLAKVKRAIVDVVRPQGYAVLNAADPLVAAMAERCPGSAIFFARNPDEPVLARHRGLGGRVVFVRDQTVILAEGEREEPLLTLDRIPLDPRRPDRLPRGKRPGRDRRRLGLGRSPATSSAPGWSRSPSTWTRCPAASTSSISTGPRWLSTTATIRRPCWR